MEKFTIYLSSIIGDVQGFLSIFIVCLAGYHIIWFIRLGIIKEDKSSHEAEIYKKNTGSLRLLTFCLLIAASILLVLIPDAETLKLLLK